MTPATTNTATISFENQIEGDVQPELLDGDGNDMDFGDTVDIGSGEDLSFSVIMDKNYPCHVRDKGELVEPESTEPETPAEDENWEDRKED